MSGLKAEYPSPLGRITMAGEGDALAGLWLEGQKYFAGGHPDLREGEAPAFAVVRAWLDAYFAGDDPGLSPRLSLEGTPFQKAVWRQLLTIPRGQTTTYGAIARTLEMETGKRVSAQAVGGAVGRNPVSILVPCHRVVGTGGSLTGYAGGLDKKLWLLRHEGVVVSKLFYPQTGTAL